MVVTSSHVGTLTCSDESHNTATDQFDLSLISDARRTCLPELFFLDFATAPLPKSALVCPSESFRLIVLGVLEHVTQTLRLVLHTTHHESRSFMVTASQHSAHAAFGHIGAVARDRISMVLTSGVARDA